MLESGARRYAEKIHRNAILIFNPNAGKLIRNPRLAERVRETLAAHGVAARLTPTARPEHATELARAAVEAGGVDLIVAMGGDGTVNEVLNGMVHSAIPLAVIPGGTANVLCCETGIPRHPEKAAALLPEWKPERVAVGRLEAHGLAPRYFLSMAGAGFDAKIVNEVQPGVKRKLGKIAYWIAGLSQFGRRLTILKVRAEGREFVTGFALTSRVRNYGGDLELATQASLFRDEFQLLTFAGRSTIPYGIYLAGSVVAPAPSLPGVQSAMTRRVELAPVDNDPVYLQVDGELAGRLPAVIELVPAAVTLLLPASARQKG
ncbi:MAG: diacylglycerol kinase family lipid kinase [Bryobacterales bacterium]|nr:diacylglycerol kinase family lipid kinase [Bryobacterales bacterium]